MSNVWTVECPICKTQYHIGKDSMVTTPDEVLRSFGTVISSSEEAIHNFYSEPDIVSKTNDSEQITKSQESVLEIRKSISSGVKRYWKCHKCNNLNNPTQYKTYQGNKQKFITSNELFLIIGLLMCFGGLIWFLISSSTPGFVLFMLGAGIVGLHSLLEKMGLF